MAGSKTIKKLLNNMKSAKSENELLMLTKSMGVKLSRDEIHELWLELHPEKENVKPEKEEKKGILAKIFGNRK